MNTESTKIFVLEKRETIIDALSWYWILLISYKVRKYAAGVPSIMCIQKRLARTNFRAWA